MDGELVDISSPAAARALGIETVYQDLALFDNLDPAANFYAGREVGRPALAAARACAWLRRRDMAEATADVLGRLKVEHDRRARGRRPHVRRPASGRSPWPARPRSPRGSSSSTSRPPPSACVSRASVLDLILRLRDEGRAVIVISHAMDHVMEIADRAAVMRRGRMVGEEIPTPDNRQRLVSLIVGGDG